MSLTKSTGKPIDIRPATGKLGILTPGMGAVATTFMAGVEAIRKGICQAHRLADADGDDSPRQADRRAHAAHQRVRAAGQARRHRVRRLGPLPRRRLQAASKAGVLSKEHLGQLKDFLSTIKPMKAVWEQAYVKKLTATHFKTGKNKADLAAQVMDDIKEFKKKNSCDRLVMVWCGSTEVFRNLAPGHATLASFEKALAEERSGDSRRRRFTPTRRSSWASPTPTARPNLTVDTPALMELAEQNDVPIGGKDFKTGQTLMKTILAPGFKARMLGVERLVLDQHPRQPRRRGARRPGVVQVEGGLQARRAGAHPRSPTATPTSTATSTTSCASTTTRRAATTKRAGTTSTSSDGWATRCRSRSTSSAGTRSWPRRSCSTSRCSWTSRSAAGCSGIQEWLSFYFKSPQSAPGLYPEHDLFIQLMKLKNTLRHLRGEDLITHLGAEYYD